MKARVYDIKNCGPRNRFVANGKLVHNSGGDKQNTTNMNRVDPKDPTSGALRKSLHAPAGHVLCVRDLGQIEARVLAYWAGQEDLLDLFRAGGDPYNRQASLIFGYEVDRKLKEFWLEGMVGKASVLGNGYGGAWAMFQEKLRVGFMGMPSLVFDQTAAEKLSADIEVFCSQRSYRKGCGSLYDEAMLLKPLNVEPTDHLWHCAATKAIVDGYRASNPAITALWKEMQQALSAIEQGFEVACGKRNLISTCADGLRLPNGMKIYYHQLRRTESGEYRYLADRRKKEYAFLYGSKCVENGVQALSRIVMTDQMLMLEDWLIAQRHADPGRVYRIVTTTYDEIVTCIPEDRAVETQTVMKQIMATAPPWCPDLPLKSSGGFAKSYGDCDK